MIPQSITGTSMTENTKTIDAVTAVPADERAEWRRPTLRRLDASESQTTLANSGSDIAFS